jgi:limonene-1,2-epoxide hydrolase
MSHPQSAFSALLERFAQAVVQGDGAALATLFTPDGAYEDGFYGVRSGPDGIRAMLAEFHAAARAFRWDFRDPVSDGRTGYARYRFAYISTLPGCEGRPVVFEGMAQFTLEGGRIVRYREVFDRGVALVQLGFVPERIARTLARYVPG